MSSLGRGMDRLFSGGEGGTFREQLAALKAEYGTVTALARGLGVDRRTIQRWESGKIRAPRQSHTEGVGRAFREKRARSAPGDADVRVSFTQQKKGGGTRNRQVDGHALGLEPGTMDSARRAYIADGPEAAAAAFVDGIGDDWYHEMFEEDLTGEGEGDDASVSDPTPTVGSVR